MSKKCVHCGAELPEEAAFCPHCAQSQIEKVEIKPPRRWRKKALIALACTLLGAFVLVAVLLYHRPEILEGGARVVYTDKDGEYELIIGSDSGNLANRAPEEYRSISLSADDASCLPALLGVFQDGELADVEHFFAKVESCTLEAFPNENGALQISPPIYSDVFAPSARECDVFFTGTSGTNQLVWTLKMKNGDTIRLSETFEVITLVHQVFTPEDAPMETIEDLKALLNRIDREVSADTIVDIYLPAVTYEGGLTMTSRAVNLYGCTDGSGRSCFTGTLSIRTDSPSLVTLCDLDFLGSGGTGLSSSASAMIFGCTFSGWDTGAEVADGGMIGVENCVFKNNGTGFRYDTANFGFFKSGFPYCTFENNGTGVQFARLPGSMSLDFSNTVFSGNEIDIDNPIDYPLDLSDAIFQ
ncbi:MAG: zinc ribbon domain-containing protein [Candidatus Limivicinus sp.]|nr:zinc ribbon domain-containing protein [Clostridiales bacterium]MDY6133985.1 zinc ribbon domain-containing protein [Candidatus Limivicinus sp.]